MPKQSAATQRERAEMTAAVYELAVANGVSPRAAVMDWWAVDRPRAGGLLWEAGALGLIPPQFASKRVR